MPTVATHVDLAALAAVLEPGERAIRSVAGVGAGMVLTDRRLHLVRSRASIRLVTGIRSWAVDADLRVRVGRKARDSKWLTITRAGQSMTVFLAGADQAELNALLDELPARATGPASRNARDSSLTPAPPR